MGTLVLSCFPAVGKTYLFNNQENKNLKILDSDSSEYSWIKRKRTEEELQKIRDEWNSEMHLLSGDGYIDRIKNDVITDRNPDFPNNYIEHIKNNIGKTDIILVSSHEDVRKSMRENGINYTLVYPSYNMKNEWIGRCWIRENYKKQSFRTKLLYLKWDEWIQSCDSDSSKKILIYKPNQYLYDIIDYIIEHR